MRDLDELVTDEMTQAEWSEYRKRWIAQHRHDLVVECGEDPNDPDLDAIAEIQFERYVGQEGYTARDERIRARREAT